MATDPLLHENALNVREQTVRIDQMLADIDQKLATAFKVKQETRFAPWTIVTTALGAGAALFAAGAAFTKLMIG